MSLAETTELHQGMGAILHENGVAFRVWAPHAEAVSVVGEFNDWDEQANPCRLEEHGKWYVNVPEAKPGDEYRFLLWNGDRKLSRIDPYSKEVTNSVGNSIIQKGDFDWSGDNFVLPAWNELVVYEMHIGTFHRRKKEAVGTFEGAIEKISYLKDLGINAIELMPLAEFAGDYSWGYNPAHPFAIETAYGGPVGYKTFVREAHKLGIGVIQDVVYNHFGPSDLELWQFDGWHQDNKGGIYFFNDWRSATPWGDTRPDYGRAEVRQYIFDNAMQWLEDYRVDGLRYDMTLFMRSVDGDESNSIEEGFSLAQWINTEIAKRYPGRITIAEDLRKNSRMTLDAEYGGAHFSAQWDAAFVHPIRETIIEIDDKNRSMHKVADSLKHKYNVDAFERVVYTESHDEVANGKQRVVSEIDPSDNPNRYAVKRSTLGAALMMTAPGIPMLLQGQEFLRDGWFDDSRAIDWERSEEFASVVQLYHDLIALRLNRHGTTNGLTGQHLEVFHVNEDHKVIAFRRWKDGGLGDDTIVIMRFAESRWENYRVGFPHPGLWKLRFNSDWHGYHESFDGTTSQHITTEEKPYDIYEFSGEFTIGAYACLIYSQDK